MAVDGTFSGTQAGSAGVPDRSGCAGAGTDTTSRREKSELGGDGKHRRRPRAAPDQRRATPRDGVEGDERNGLDASRPK